MQSVNQFPGPLITYLGYLGCKDKLSRLLDQVYSYPSCVNDYRNKKGKTTLKEFLFDKLKKTVYLKEKYEVYRGSIKLTQPTYEFILTQLINFL